MLLVWLLLALLLLILVVGSWHVFVRTRAVFRALGELGDGTAAALAGVDAAAARVTESSERLPGGGERLELSLARFARTRAEFAVLTSAVAETAALGRGVRSLVPRK